MVDSPTRKISLFEEAGIKDKAVPLQAWIGPDGSTRLRLSEFRTIGT